MRAFLLQQWQKAGVSCGQGRGELLLNDRERFRLARLRPVSRNLYIRIHTPMQVASKSFLMGVRGRLALLTYLPAVSLLSNPYSLIVMTKGNKLKLRFARMKMINYLKSKGIDTRHKKQKALIRELAQQSGLEIRGNARNWLLHIYHSNTILKGFSAKPKKITKEDKNKYHKYLESDEWKSFRLKALEFYGNECGTCGTRYNLHVHHKTYVNIFREHLQDVMILCKACHEKAHNKKF